MRLKRRTFSLLALLTAVAAVACAFGMWRYHHDRFLRQRRIANNILRLVRTDGNINPSDEDKWGPMHPFRSRFGHLVRIEYKDAASEYPTHEPGENRDVVAAAINGSLEIENGNTGQPIPGAAGYSFVSCRN